MFMTERALDVLKNLLDEEAGRILDAMACNDDQELGHDLDAVEELRILHNLLGSLRELLIDY